MLSMTYIDSVVAPDLTDCRSVRVHYTLRMVFHSAELPQGDNGRLVLLFLQVVDKTFREYSAGRAVLESYASSANESHLYHEGVSRFETCINSVVRALRLADRIARGVGAPEVNRLTRRRLTLALDALRPLRDATEHMDEDITGGKVAEGEAHALMVAQDGATLEIAKYRLTFTELAGVLRQLHGLATELIDGLAAAAPASGTASG